ncbi:SAM-dependent methyltransferase [Paenibacillus sp. LHD-38]|uniref:class I SAM-dependent methyltransferase n=1 Tax=Paenibacillus sp. LHD-38 TaxID=3072143 RepID=UPI00280F33AC|nr:SAM-dependent methyltransferase [Paenibacillus sp. LHD-38]MDQ8736841.1 SAM-dependent methyltransferase [Paenibacillus sp. LHD-38]
MNEKELAASIGTDIAASSLIGWPVNSRGEDRSVPCISFLRYMNACLYDVQYGYYTSGPTRVGKDGDFYTSSGIGQVLSEVLAGYAITYGKTLNVPLKLIEWGAGTGRLSAQIAAAGRRRSHSWNSSFQPILIEDHPLHMQEARQTFADLSSSGEAGQKAHFFSSNEAWEASCLREPALVLANELLDAFPVHLVACIDGQIVEIGVAGDAAQGFYEVYMPLTDSRISGWLERDGIKLREGQRTEIHSGAADFLKRLGSVMTRGRLILIDYGHEADEYAAEHRMRGTLMCYWRHIASDNPYIRIGQQDITSHVPFTFVRNEALESGWRVIDYITQKQFLIENGVLEMLQNYNGTDPFSEEMRKNRAIRQLLLSDQMSESFKVMVLDKI